MARNGGDKRGPARARRARKWWMFATWGTGKTCPCVHCGKRLTFKTVEADRIQPGGSYARDNVQPSCGLCNKKRSNNSQWAYAVHFSEKEYGPEPVEKTG